MAGASRRLLLSIVSYFSGGKVGRYQVLAGVGGGGLGVVSGARAARIDRTVAIKVLIGEHSENAELRERFEHEARAISRLNHPNICTLHDVGEQDGTHFLVMEYVEGETLAKRLEKGALPLGEMLRIGGEVAGALAAAHRQGVVHRDLKPGNVMVGRNGVKLLDFGLAKLHAASHGLGPGQAATEIGDLTRTGQIMGTFQYMSPEQAEGREADARSDVFALGAMLYEMATGRRPFEGATRASLMAAVLRLEPPAVTALVPGLPAQLDLLIGGCLAKDPDARWQCAADVGRLLRSVADGAAAAGAPDRPRRGGRVREALAWTLAAAAVLAGVAASIRRPPSERPRITTVRTLPPTAGALDSFAAGTSLALAPAGDRLAVVTRVGGVACLSVWSLRAGSATRLEDTDGATSPFWSPDGDQIGFFAQGKLRRIAASGGPATTVCDAEASAGGSWSRGGVIIFSEWVGENVGLRRVSAQGGTAAAIVPHGAEVLEVPGWPEFLPDGRHVLFVSGVFRLTGENRRVGVIDIDTGETTMVTQADGKASFSSGHLLFVRRGALLAAPFSLSTRRLSGEPVQVAAHLRAHAATGMAEYAAVAASSVLILRDPSPTSDLVWFDRSGRRLGALAGGQLFGRFRLSPDETLLAVEAGDIAAGGRQLYALDARSGIGTRLTFEAGEALSPVWAPNGAELAYSAVADQQGPDLSRRPLRGMGVDRLLGRIGAQLAQDWSPDGRLLAYEELSPTRAAQRQVWLLPMGAGRAPYVLLDAPFSSYNPRFSPDSRFLVFVSEESGTAEVYVAPVAEPSSKQRISPAGGTRPRWTRGGRELIYQTLDDLLVAVPITTGRSIVAGNPDPLFRIESFQAFEYEVTGDGNRFLVNVASDAMADRTMTIVSSWPEAIAGRGDPR